MTKDIVLILGIGLFILALVGRVNTPHFEVGVRSKRKRVVLGIMGISLGLAFFSSDLVAVYRSIFPLRSNPVVLIELIETSSSNQDLNYVGNKVHRNLSELLNNAGHRVIAPPLSVGTNAFSNSLSKKITIRLNPDGENLAIHVDLLEADGSLLSSTELNGPLSDLKEIYKVLPETILFGLDTDASNLKIKNTVKPPTANVLAFAHYLYARRQIESGNVMAAQKALERSISHDKRFALAYWSLGALLKEQGKPVKGQELVQEANRIDPDHSKIPLGSPFQKSDPVQNLMLAILANPPQELEPGFIIHKAISKDYGLQIHIWNVDPADFEIDIVEQSDPFGLSVSRVLKNEKAILALNGGFFDIDSSKRLSPAGILVVNGIIRNSAPNQQSGALVRRRNGIKIIWAKDLGKLTQYNFVLQTGPILVEEQGKLGIKHNDYDRLNRAAVCSRGREIIFVILKGLHGQGLSLYEFAELLVGREKDGGIECDLAVNLDGGPSTQAELNFKGVREKVEGLWKVNNSIIVRKK